MNIIEIEFATPEYDETVNLRDSILRKPLNLSFSEEELAEEYTDIHLAAYDAAWVLRGCLVLTPKSENVIKMRQVAVVSDVQGMASGGQWSKKAKSWRAHAAIPAWNSMPAIQLYLFMKN